MSHLDREDFAEELHYEASRDAFFEFSTLAALEVARRLPKAPINPVALLMAIDSMFTEKFGDVFLDLGSMEEKVEVFNAGVRQAIYELNKDEEVMYLGGVPEEQTLAEHAKQSLAELAIKAGLFPRKLSQLFG